MISARGLTSLISQEFSQIDFVFLGISYPNIFAKTLNKGLSNAD